MNLFAAESLIKKPVNDYAGIIPPYYEKMITQKILEHRKRTGVQIAVLTVNTTGEKSIDDFSLLQARAWGGGSADRDDGLLYTVAVKDRKFRIERGAGLDGYLSDEKAWTILLAIQEDYRNGKFGPGTMKVVEELCSATASIEAGKAIPLHRRAGGIFMRPLRWYSFFYFISIVITFLFLFSWKRNNLPAFLLWSMGLLLWGALPVLIFLFYPGVWHWKSYLYAVGIFGGTSLYAVSLMKSIKGKVVSLLSALGPIAWLGISSVWYLDMLKPNPYGTSDNETMMLLFMIFATFTQLMVWMAVHITAIDGWTSGGGGGYYSGGSNTGSDGTSSSSSSSSGSSYGGGGGSFRGGGASGSW